MKSVYVLFIFLVSQPALAQGKPWCERHVLETYNDYRSALLSNNFSPEIVEKFMSNGYRSNIKEGMYLRHFQSLRLIEAKITSITAYSVKCTENGMAVLTIKTNNIDQEYNRRVIHIKKVNDHYIISSTSDEIGTESFDKGITFAPHHENL